MRVGSLDEYHQVVPSAQPLMTVLVVRAVNLAFLASTVALILLLFRKASRIRLVEQGTDVVFLIGAVHASYLATALVEAGLERYTAPTWSLMVAAIIRVFQIEIQDRSTIKQSTSGGERRSNLMQHHHTG
jgi:hypothetical protein